MRRATAPDQGSSGAEHCRTMVQAACLLTSTGELMNITTEYEGLKKGINDIVATEWNWHGSQLLLLDRAASIVGERVLQPAIGQAPNREAGVIQ